MKLAASGFLGGAASRLLPFSIPFRFFVAAAVFHIGAWTALAIGAHEVVGFRGGLGWPLAALHLLTLGVLAMTAMGAAFQLLTVATRQPLRALWPARAAWWLFLPGVAGMAHGMAKHDVRMTSIAASLAIAALLLFTALVADNLRRARGMGLVVAHGWAALAALVVVLALGGLLVAGYSRPLPFDLGSVATAHFIVAVYGFMGLFAVGFSYILMPMFALSPAPPPRLAGVALGLAVVALATGVAGALGDVAWAPALAAALGLLATGLHLQAMRVVWRTRMRKDLGQSFKLIRLAWILLPLSLALGLTLALGLNLRGGPALLGFLAVVGWLLTFLTGVLQRIMPFLASMHAAKRGGRAPLISELAPRLPLHIHAACHVTALAIIALAILVESPIGIRAGAMIGAAGAVAFAIYAIAVVRRTLAGGAPTALASQSR